MSIYDSLNDIISRIRNDFKLATGFANPNNKNQLINGLVVAEASISDNFNKEIIYNVIPNSFVQSVQTEDDLLPFSIMKNIPQNQPSISDGYISAIGTLSTIIPLGTQFSINGNIYTSKADATIISNAITVTITRSSSTATVTTLSTHPFATGMSIIMSGAGQAEYNGTFTILSTGLTSFTYTVSGSPATPATGTITATCNIANIEIQSNSTGSTQNLNSGDTVSLVNNIAGVNSTSYVQYSGITGGTDIEDFYSWRDRVHLAYTSPITNYNVANITATAKSISGVTKVWVYPITPAVGQCTVYFIRGNDANIIPTAPEIVTVKTAISTLLSANDSTSDLFIYAPTPVSTAFAFTAISPDTAAMRQSIIDNLNQLFSENADIGVTIKADRYKTAIYNAYDANTGLNLASYTLTSPSVDITLTSGQLATLGNVTWS